MLSFKVIRKVSIKPPNKPTIIRKKTGK